LPHWGVVDVKSYKASAKLLLYYHPEAPIAAEQLRTWSSASRKNAMDKQVTFLIEPIMYGIGEYSGASKTEATLATVAKL
jgi:hypothetical protein